MDSIVSCADWKNFDSDFKQSKCESVIPKTRHSTNIYLFEILVSLGSKIGKYF
jgi:hypothetical protein